MQALEGVAPPAGVGHGGEHGLGGLGRGGEDLLGLCEGPSRSEGTLTRTGSRRLHLGIHSVVQYLGGIERSLLNITHRYDNLKINQ